MSSDEKKWTTLFDGKSSGTSLEYESFPITKTKAQYVRIVGMGNTNPEFHEWINLTEVKIYTRVVQK